MHMVDTAIMRRLMREWGTTNRDVEYMQASRRMCEEQLADLFDPPCTPRLTGMPGSGAVSDITAQTAIRANAAATEIRSHIADIDRMIARRIRLRRVIDWGLYELTPAQRDTLRHRFEATDTHPYGMEWSEVAEAMGQDERQLKRWEVNSLQRLSSFVLYYAP